MPRKTILESEVDENTPLTGPDAPIIIYKKKPGILDKASMAWFNIGVVWATVTSYIVAVASLNPFGIWPAPLDQKIANLTVMSLSFCYKVVFALQPFIKFKHFGDENFAKVGASGKPVIIIGNHVSFLDTCLFLAKMPLSQAGPCRVIYKQSLEKLPMFQKIAHACKNVAIPFKNETDFSVQEEGKKAVDEGIMAALAAGRTFCLYPEGGMSNNQREVQSFRHGSFAYATKLDCELWGFAHAGHADMWHKTGAGGNPSVVACNFFPICPEGAKKFLESKKMEVDDYKGLAKACEDMMQKEVDEVFDKIDGEKPPSGLLHLSVFLGVAAAAYKLLF